MKTSYKFILLGKFLEISGGASSKIDLTSTPTVIHILGTIKTGSATGTTEFQWAQSSSNANAITILQGSYLKAEALQ